MVKTMAHAASFGASWTDQGTSIKFDAISLAVALLLHFPLYFVKLDASKRSLDRSNTSRLVSIDLIEPELPKPVVVAPPPPVKESKFMEKLKALMKKEPPPPPPPAPKVKPPEKLLDAPKPIELQAKLNMPETAPKLESKAGFKTTADPKLVKDQKLAMKDNVGGIAPLSAKKLGTMDDRASLKSTKGNFQVAQKDALTSIGNDSGPALAGGAPPPVVALRTGKTGTTEKFSAPATQKADKGRLGAVPGTSLNSAPLGLRDAIIARDAAPTQIGSSVRGTTGGVPGGVSGGTGKKDAGNFQGGQPGSYGTAGIPPIGSVQSAPQIAQIAPKKKEKKSLFVITGPLQNRKIDKQVAPEYPAWAQAQGIEAAVVLEFTVEPSGAVKNSIVVRRTSGYPKLDETAVKALRQWKFAPLAEDENREEVGLITFNYSLS